jgi:hypothetical protein
MRKARKASGLRAELEDDWRTLTPTRCGYFPALRHLCRRRYESPEGQRAAFTGSGLISDISLDKLKSVGAAPVISRAPRLNVRFWIPVIVPLAADKYQSAALLG